MSEFEKSLLDRIEAMQKAEDAKRAEEVLKAQKHKEDLEKVRRIGSEIVDLLTKYNVPTVDIWQQTNIGVSRPTWNHGRSYDNCARANELIGQGWKLFSKRVQVDRQEYRIDYFGIDTLGNFLEYKPDDRTGLEDVLSIEGTSPLAKGMVNPVKFKLNHPEIALRELESEICQNGIASLIRPYSQQTS